MSALSVELDKRHRLIDVTNSNNTTGVSWRPPIISTAASFACQNITINLTMTYWCLKMLHADPFEAQAERTRWSHQLVLWNKCAQPVMIVMNSSCGPPGNITLTPPAKMPRYKLTFGSVNGNYLLKGTRSGFLLRGSCLLHARLGSARPGPGIDIHAICTRNCNMHSKGARISSIPISHAHRLVWPVSC